jgi:hypothetical protein
MRPSMRNRRMADRSGRRHPGADGWEDLHWADPTTLETLGMLIEQAPLLVVATYRPKLTLPWPQRSHRTPITLNRLEQPEVETMVEVRPQGPFPCGVPSRHPGGVNGALHAI